MQRVLTDVDQVPVAADGNVGEQSLDDIAIDHRAEVAAFVQSLRGVPAAER